MLRRHHADVTRIDAPTQIRNAAMSSRCGQAHQVSIPRRPSGLLQQQVAPIFAMRCLEAICHRGEKFPAVSLGTRRTSLRRAVKSALAGRLKSGPEIVACLISRNGVQAIPSPRIFRRTCGDLSKMPRVRTLCRVRLEDVARFSPSATGAFRRVRYGGAPGTARVRGTAETRLGIACSRPHGQAACSGHVRHLAARREAETP